ncbi:MAG: enolase C-terminal domain-like protein [Pseudomonadota bacterium]
MKDLDTEKTEPVGSIKEAIVAGVSVDLFSLKPKKSYSMAGQDYSGQNYFGVLVRVRTEEGAEGLGEVFVTPGWYGPDSPLSYVYLISQVFTPVLIGKSVFNTAELVQRMDRLWMGNLWSKAALETALYDAAAKTLGVPLADLLGGRSRERFPLVGGVGEDTPEEMAHSAREYVDRGFKTIKLKIGSIADPDLDVARVRLVREEIGPHVVLRVDANGVYGSDVRGAVKLIRKIEAFDLDHVEQPLSHRQFRGMARVREAIDVPLMADESVHTLEDAHRVIDAGAADIVKLKMAKNGGYRKCSELISACVEAGLRIELGNGIQSSIASFHELTLACSNPNVMPAGEFPGPDKLVSDIADHPLQIEDGDALLPIAPGIGTELCEESFQACRIDLTALAKG